ncbi:MAG: ABC transporter substrate-binding protein [Bacteriovorax sp.]|nr:ABC transporter substrate-binding protein [Bacteriovorax sp.]
MRIGYFHGGRTLMLYRAQLNGEYDKEEIKVELITKNLNQSDYFIVPKSHDQVIRQRHFGKATGDELVNLLIEGKLDGATIGEVAFIKAVLEKKSIIAVAQLGFDTLEHPGHGIVIRSGIKINTPKDLKGLIFGSRRSSGGDLIFLREFLLSEGLDPDKDVEIIENIPEDKYLKYIADGTIQAGFSHLLSLRKLVNRKKAYIYRPMNWINPELSQGVLVFSEKYLREHPDNVEKMIRTYMKRISYEISLPTAQRRPEVKDTNKGLEMETDFHGMNLPQYHKVPLVPINLLNQMQALLVKHHKMDKIVHLENFIDDRFVKNVANELYPQGKTLPFSRETFSKKVKADPQDKEDLSE